MELNITKENLSINEQCFSQNIEHGVNFDVSMPDYCAAVQRILKSSVVPKIVSKNCSSQTLSLDGDLCFSLLYLDEEGCLHNFEHHEAFNKSVEVGENAENCTFTVACKCGYFNTKAVSLRRLSVNSVVQLNIKGNCKKTTEIVADIDCADVYQNRGTAAATLPISTAEKNIIIEEELEIGHTQPAVNRILRYSAEATVSGHKIINDKVIVKGELHIDVLYCAEGKNRTEKYNASLPFSQIMDLDGVSEECTCNVCLEVASVDIKPRNGYDGDAKSFLLNARVCISVEAVCNNDIPVIFDAYSPKYNLDLCCEKAKVSKMIEDISESYICKKKLDFSDGDIANIIDLWCDGMLTSSHTDGLSIVANGTVIVYMLCESTDGNINYFERPIDFEYRYDAGSLPENSYCNSSICVLNSGYAITGDNSLDVRIELQINTSVFENNTLNIVTDVKLCDICNVCGNEYSMMIYYASCGEKVWDIAKRFNTSPDEIIKINEIEEVLNCDKTLLIPC